MIKINLIGEEKRKKKKKPIQLKNFTVIFAVVMALVILINGGAAAYLYFTVNGLEEEKKANIAKLAELDKRIGEVKKFEELNKDITNRKAILSELKKFKVVPVRLMDEINQTIPEGLWITKVDYNKDGVTIEGIGLTNIAVVSYIENLKKSKVANTVYLIESNQVEFEKVPVYKFKLNFKVNV